MVFKKKEEQEKDLTMQEAIVELGKSMKEIKAEITELKKPKPQEQPTETEPVTPEVKPKVKEENFIIYDQPIKTKRIILDNTDPDKPIVYDTESALAKLLNDIVALKKALA